MYDPLIDTTISQAAPYPASYWAEHTAVSDAAPKLQQDIQCEIAIVGAGYTGLSCAIALAGQYQRDVVLIDANQPAWGCSGRNAGFVLRGTGRLGLSQLSARFGSATALQCHKEYGKAIERVQQLIEQAQISCDMQQPGYLKVAHSAKMGRDLPAQAQYLNEHFGYAVQYISPAELKHEYMQNAQAHGAIRFPDCFGVNPLALAHGYANYARKLGAKLYGDSAVKQWQPTTNGFELVTDAGKVSCKQLIWATNAYTPAALFPRLNRACFPVLSSVIVTQPLTAEQIQQTGLHHNQLVMDTRALKYYYRKLPDNRILFGGRSAVYGKDAMDARYPKRLLQALSQCFPALKSLRCDYHWSGWVAVSYDDLPRVSQVQNNLYYAAGYCGSGLSFSSLAGLRLAQLAMGEVLPALPFYQSELPAFPLPAFRRIGQQAFYQWGRFKDRYLT